MKRGNPMGTHRTWHRTGIWTQFPWAHTGRGTEPASGPSSHGHHRAWHRTGIWTQFSHLVKGVHGHEHHPGDVQSLDDLAGHGGFTRGTASAQACGETNGGGTWPVTLAAATGYRPITWLQLTLNVNTLTIVNPPKLKPPLFYQHSDNYWTTGWVVPLMPIQVEPLRTIHIESCVFGFSQNYSWFMIGLQPLTAKLMTQAERQSYFLNSWLWQKCLRFVSPSFFKIDNSKAVTQREYASCGM